MYKHDCAVVISCTDAFWNDRSIYEKDRNWIKQEKTETTLKSHGISPILIFGHVKRTHWHLHTFEVIRLSCHLFTVILFTGRGVADPPGRPPTTDTPPGQTSPRQTPLHRDGHCSGRYASYWNAFLFSVCSTKFELLQNSSVGNASRCKDLIKQKEASLQNCFRLATSLHGNTVNYKKPWCNVKKCRKGERRLTDQLGAVDIYVRKGIVDKRVCLKYGIVLGDVWLTADGYVIITV